MIKDILSLLEKEEEAILTIVEVGEGVVLDAFDRIEAAVNKRIAELEAQVPKVVKPQMRRHVSGPYWICNCATVLDGIARFKYCPYCGSKLNWEEE